MPRWEPHGSERLVAAALDLFEEQGYDAATVADIAARAGMAKSTFFRLFSDKREVLFAGHEALAELIAEGARKAEKASLAEVVRAALAAVALAFPETIRSDAPRRRDVIATSPELQERSALKRAGMATALAEALTERGVPALTARVAAETGVVAFSRAHELWADLSDSRPFADLIPHALDEVLATQRTLTDSSAGR